MDYFRPTTMKKMSVRERRIDQRFQVRWPIHILAADGSRRGKTEDVSLGGAFIRCEKPPPLDEKVLLTYENPSGDKPIGMGVEFLQFLSSPRPLERPGIS
jgi:hypothetical protein